MKTPDWASVRAEYPALANTTYLNTATYGQTSRASVAAAMRHFERRNALACADFLSWFDDMDRIREKIARVVNAPSADDIAFCSTASHALSWFVNGLDWQPGDRVISLAGEFPNNTYFPATLTHAGVEFIETEWSDIGQHLDAPGLKAVFLSTVNYSSGLKPDLDGLAERLHKTGALLYVDGTQSVGALRFDVERWKPDMLSVNGYKWMNSPNGAGFAYVAPSLRAKLRPTNVGWRSDKGWRGVDQLSHGEPVFSENAERYEGGMLNFPCLYAMEPALDFLIEAGIDVVEARVMEMAAKCTAVLESFGGVVAYPGSQILAASFDGKDASALAVELKAAGVQVSARHGRLRVSTHFYNDESDLARLADALRAAF